MFHRVSVLEDADMRICLSAQRADITMSVKLAEIVSKIPLRVPLVTKPGSLGCLALSEPKDIAAVWGEL